MSQWVRNVINPIEVIIYSKSIELQTGTPWRFERWMLSFSHYAELQQEVIESILVTTYGGWK